MQNLCMPPQSPIVLVHIERFEGSSPREVGAWMRVGAGGFEGTVGGGHLEFEALGHARRMLAQVGAGALTGAERVQTLRYALGPSLGQCCGGVVWLRFECFESLDAPDFIAAYADLTAVEAQKRMKVALFGGGHVGKALVRAFALLPMQVLWVDSRDEIFPAHLPANVVAEHSSPVQAAVGDLAAGSAVLIMSFSHAEDLDVVAACLLRLRAQNDLPFVGLIGSKTKWATFQNRLRERGFGADELARITCPIGVDGVHGKEPEVIAASVAAQLLRWR